MAPVPPRWLDIPLGQCLHNDVVRKRSVIWSTIQSLKFPATTSRERFSAITGIWAPMESEKKVCQRLADQVSSLRWDLVCPIQLMVLKKRILLGASSSWDSRSVISVRSTESSTVATMHCCEYMFNCSARSEPVNMSLRSWTGCQWLSICWMKEHRCCLLWVDKERVKDKMYIPQYPLLRPATTPDSDVGKTKCCGRYEKRCGKENFWILASTGNVLVLLLVNFNTNRKLCFARALRSTWCVTPGTSGWVLVSSLFVYYKWRKRELYWKLMNESGWWETKN